MKDKEFYVTVGELQPSQLFISEEKMKRNEEWLHHGEIDYDAIPIIDLNGKMVMTDGHTRAVILSKLGIEKIRVTWDCDELDLEAYLECVSWCDKEGIHSVRDLEHRIISAEEYLTLWIGKCHDMQKALEIGRKVAEIK